MLHVVCYTFCTLPIVLKLPTPVSPRGSPPKLEPVLLGRTRGGADKLPLLVLLVVACSAMVDECVERARESRITFGALKSAGRLVELLGQHRERVIDFLK